MNRETPPPLLLTGFEVAPVWAGATLELEMRGSADMRASVALKAYLKGVDGDADRLGIDAVRVKLKDLYFMNSSCFQALASWLGGIIARAPERRYCVTFETHPGQPWQKRSLEAIRRMAPDVILVA